MLILTTLVMFVLLVITAFAIDLATIMVAHHKAQLAADAGALAAAQDMETSAVNNSTVTTDGSDIATTNYPGASVTISEPSAGNEAEAKVNGSIALPFGRLWGKANASVSAFAVAQVQANTAAVVGGSINDITPSQCQGNNTYCEYDASRSCASQSTWGANAYGGYFYWGPEIASSPWYIYAGYNTSTSVGNCASVDFQDCDGAVGGNCLDIHGNPITNEEVVDLDGDSTGGIYQTVTDTIAGDHYVLSFYLTGNPAAEDCSHATFTGYVQVNNQSTTGTRLAYKAFSHTNPCSNGSETAEFEEVTVPFVASSQDTTLIFESTTCMATAGGSDNCGWEWVYGPEVTDVMLANASVVLVQ